MSQSSDRIKQAISGLVGALTAEKVVSEGPDYEAACGIWNAAVTAHPAAIVRCRSARDVQSAVKLAVKHGVSLSIRGGGHDWAGRGLKGDIVLDLSQMRDVSIDGEVAVVQGGALGIDVAEAVSAQGMVAITGIIGSVGMTGLATGGGYGHLTAKYGLALDHIIGAEIVLADGRLIDVDETSEPDLFWAIRGGGGNFGAITRLRIRLYRDGDISDGAIAFPWEQAHEIFANYNRLIGTIPNGLTVMPTFFAAPDGKLSIMLHHAWCGDQREDDRLLEQVSKLGVPTMVHVARKTLAQILTEAERRTMSGIHWIVRTVTLPDIPPEAVSIIKAAMEDRSSPLSWIAAHPFYGAGEQVPVAATAFGIRCRHMMVGIYTAWQPGDDTTHREWADKVEAALQPYALPSSYPNYFGTDRPAQAAQAYGPNAERLLQVKRRYDPTGVFSAISLPPG